MVVSIRSRLTDSRIAGPCPVQHAGDGALGGLAGAGRADDRHRRHVTGPAVADLARSARAHSPRHPRSRFGAHRWLSVATSQRPHVPSTNRPGTGGGPAAGAARGGWRTGRGRRPRAVAGPATAPATPPAPPTTQRRPARRRPSRSPPSTAPAPGQRAPAGRSPPSPRRRRVARRRHQPRDRPHRVGQPARWRRADQQPRRARHPAHTTTPPPTSDAPARRRSAPRPATSPPSPKPCQRSWTRSDRSRCTETLTAGVEATNFVVETLTEDRKGHRTRTATSTDAETTWSPA